MPKKYVLDTNIIQSKAVTKGDLPSKVYVSAVVLSELMTAANDTKELKGYQESWKVAAENSLLLVLLLLAQERKQQAGGKSPKRSPAVKQEIALDCLLAISAHREGVIVITNDHDFGAIQRYRKGLQLQRYPF